MARVEGWPISHAKNLIKGDLDSGVAIATLWTKRAEVSGYLDPSQYAVIGQLYSNEEGLSEIIRNLRANTGIRHLIVAGSQIGDTNGGEVLMALWKNGIDDRGNVIGVERAALQPQITSRHVDEVRGAVNIYDLRVAEKTPVEMIAQKIQGLLPTLPKLPDWGEPEIIPSPPVEIEKQKPSEVGSITVRGETAEEAWIRIQKTVMDYGEEAMTNYGNPALDVKSLVAVVRNPDPTRINFPEYLPLTPQQALAYMEKMIDPTPPGPGIAYTYGNRLRAYGPNKIDQLEIMVHKLLKDPNDRGATAIFYDPVIDNQLDKAPEDRLEHGHSSSCLHSVQVYVGDGAVGLIANFRSHEMYRAWIENFWGLMGIHSYVRSALKERGGIEYRVGPITTISNRAHIYQDRWNVSKKVVKEYFGKHKIAKYAPDPRGAIRIDFEEDEEGGGMILRALHTDLEGTVLGSREGFTAKAERNRASVRIEKLIGAQDLILDPTHGMYVGRELLLAEIAAKCGLDYEQDTDVTMKGLMELVRKAHLLEDLIARGQIQI